MDDRLEDLLFAWEEDALTNPELEELIARLESDTEDRSATVEHFSLSRALGEQLHEALHDESVVRELQRMASSDPQLASPKGTGKRWLAFSTAAALLIAACVAYRLDVHNSILAEFAGHVVVNVEDPRPVVTGVFGDVQLVGTDGSAETTVEGATLDLGQSLRTSRNSYATLLYPDRTKIELRGDTHITIEPNRSGKHLALRQGGLFADVAAQPKGAPLVINPDRDDRVEVVGTRFEIVRRAATSVVRVETGKVAFGPVERAIEVGHRQESTASSNQKPTLPQPIEPESIWRGWEHGLRGDYYDWVGFGGKHFTRIDPRIDFRWGKETPDPSFKNEFAVRWTGEIEAPDSGEFTFHTVAHYGVWLWVDGESLIDSGASMGAEEHSVPVQLEKGHRYSIRIDYIDRHGDAHVKLLWSSRSMPKSIVDQQWLYPVLDNEESGNP